MNQSASPKKIVIIGGGFGGLRAAQQLGNQPGCQVDLIDRRNHHLFQPLLYQVAMAGLDPSDIASPLRSIVRRYSNVQTTLAEVADIDVDNKTIRCKAEEDEVFSYDYLIVAAGATHAYFGNDQWEPFAPGLKTIPQATEIRRRVLTAFEEAEQASDPTERAKWLTFVLVGGGPTGVELAGQIAEMARNTLVADFKAIDVSQTKVILVQGGDRVLEQFPKKLCDYGKDALESMGVEVRLGHHVTDIDAEGVCVGDVRIEAKTVIWAAGVKASPLGQCLGVTTDRAGRVEVGSDMAIAGSPNVFVIGDLALKKDDKGNLLPGIAPVAIQQGKYVGKLIRNEIRDQINGKPVRERQPFEYFDKGQMATIGRRRAVMQSGKLNVTGTLAWLGWLLIHIVYLNGFRNRFFVMFSWTWSYLTYARGARLIIPKTWRENDHNT